MSSLPDWVVLASPVVAFLSSLVSASVAWASIRASNRNQGQQRELQGHMQQVDIEEKRQADLRTKRREAYRTMGWRATMIDPTEPFEFSDLAEAHFDVEMLTDSTEVQEAAANLYRAAHDARKEARKAWEAGFRPATKDPEVELAAGWTHELKGRFMDAARKELGLPDRPMQRRNALEIRQMMLPSEPRNSSRTPWWRRVFGG